MGHQAADAGPLSCSTVAHVVAHAPVASFPGYERIASSGSLVFKTASSSRRLRQPVGIEKPAFEAALLASATVARQRRGESAPVSGGPLPEGGKPPGAARIGSGSRSRSLSGTAAFRPGPPSIPLGQACGGASAGVVSIRTQLSWRREHDGS